VFHTVVVSMTFDLSYVKLGFTFEHYKPKLYLFDGLGSYPQYQCSTGNIYSNLVHTTLFPAGGVCCLRRNVYAHACHLHVRILVTIILLCSWRKYRPSRSTGVLYYIYIHCILFYMRHAEVDFSIYLIFPAALRPDSASNNIEYQESSWGVKGGRRVRLTTLPPSVSRLSRENMGASMSHNPMGLYGLSQG
jgi:hypothetical protein